jgi:hypothetical protein
MRLVVVFTLMLALGSSAVAAKTPVLPKAPVPKTTVVSSQRAPATALKAALKPTAEHRIALTPAYVRTEPTLRPRIRPSRSMVQMPSALRSLRYQLELHDMAAALRR